MLAQLKSLTKETLVYGFSTVLGKFLNFILVPFYVNVLSSTAEYGIMTSLYVYLGFLNVIVPLGLEAAYFRYASKGEQETRSQDEEQRLFSTPWLSVLIFGSIVATAIILLAPILIHPIFADGKTDIAPMAGTLTTIVRYGAVILLLDALAVIPFAALRLEHRAMKFALIRLFNIVMTLVLNFVFILTLDLGVEGIFLANLVASAGVLALLSPHILQKLNWKIDRDILRKFLPFGLTNVPAYLGSMVVQVINRPIVQAILGLSVLGIYQANYRMGVAMMVLVGLFEYAWRPFFLRQAKTDDARARLLFAKVLTYFMLMVGFAFLFFSFYMPHIVSTPIFGRTLLRRDYFAGLHIIPIILGAYAFQGMYTNFLAGIYIKDRNKVLPYITGAGAVVNVLANYALIPVLGMTGAALATLLAYAVMALYIYYESNKVYPVPYEWKRIALLVVVILAVFTFERLVVSQLDLSRGMYFLAQNSLLALTVLILFVTKFFEKREVDMLKSMMRIGGKKEMTMSPQDPVQRTKERTKAAD
ncbi:MAG TPA: lipopolysaccharide biosynthesis protein [Candidatus Kapabacteria bacterium]|nr:lipopolysaccharide biosynthesis protein [Candidatus Kapabacteria bacterium]